MNTSCLLRSLLRKIQESAGAIRLIQPHRSFSRIDLAFCAGEARDGPLRNDWRVAKSGSDSQQSEDKTDDLQDRIHPRHPD